MLVVEHATGIVDPQNQSLYRISFGCWWVETGYRHTCTVRAHCGKSSKVVLTEHVMRHIHRRFYGLKLFQGLFQTLPSSWVAKHGRPWFGCRVILLAGVRRTQCLGKKRRSPRRSRQHCHTVTQVELLLVHSTSSGSHGLCGPESSMGKKP